jgi:hydroxyacylglutathione hydrolase
MKLFFHFSVIGFSNTYLIGNNDGGAAILVDPGHMDLELLKLIEDNNYYIKYVLLTHRHASHTKGLKTLSKIYDVEIFANSPHIHDFPVHIVSDDSHMNLAGFDISAFLIPGHSSDSMVFKISDALFTGDVLMAGRIGSTTTSLSRSLLLRSIREKILPFNENTIIFPGHGTPTTLGIEKIINTDLMPHRHGSKHGLTGNNPEFS